MKSIILAALLLLAGFSRGDAATPCIGHNFVSQRADSADKTQIQPSHWNDCHRVDNGALQPYAVTLPANTLLGRLPGTDGVAQGITVGQGLLMSGGVLSATGSGGGGGGVSNFSQLLSGVNISAAMTVGSNASLGFAGTGTVNANRWNGSSLIDLATHTAGNLPVSKLNGGSLASADTVWRGDGTWASFIKSISPGNGIALAIANPGIPNISAATQMSLAADAQGIKLVNDAASPGNIKCYGTNASGTKGWYDCLSGGNVSTSGTIATGGFARFVNSTSIASSSLLTETGGSVYVGDTSAKRLTFNFANAAAGTSDVIVPATNPILVAAATCGGADFVKGFSTTTGAVTCGTPSGGGAFTFTNSQRVMGRNSSGGGSGEEVTASQMFDWLGSTRGSIMYRGASGWTILQPGNNGKFLMSNGAGADPTYETVSGAGISGLTSGAIPKATGATTIADSSLNDCGSNLWTLGPCDTAADGKLELGRVKLTNRAAPTTPETGLTEVYVDSTTKNLAAKDDAGVIRHGVKTTTATSNQYVTSIDADGTVNKAQPAFSNLTGNATAAQGGTGQTSYTAGDMLYASGSTAISKLGVGSNGQCMTVVSGLPAWGSCSGSGASGDITDVIAGAGLSGGASTGAATVTWAPDTFVGNITLWDSANASRTLTAGLSGATDPVITFSNNSVDVTTGALKVAGTAVSVAGHTHAAGDVTSGTFGTALIADDAITYAKLQNISATQRVLGRNTAGAGDPEEVTASQLIDWVGSTRGSVLYRGASGWAALTPGTSGHALISAGAGADPAYGAVSTPTSTDTLTNKTFDAAASGNVLKMKGYIQLSHPHSCDGTGATIGTTSTAITYGHATFSNSADESANYCEYLIHVPTDIDTSVALRARLKFLLGNTDTGTHRYVLSTVSVADSAVPGSATLANGVNLDFAGDASGANGDVQSVGWTTLTNWAGALTADGLWRIRLARDGNATQDASTVNSTELGLTIEYGITQ